ncbi:SUMO ligase siz1 [Toensbergia leucococca]|nr:SUMO ligase siz1 [Toensbergia leucococca]
MASAGPLDAHSVIAKVKTLINAHLRAVLKGEGLAVSGVKAAMQERIISHIEGIARKGDIARLNRVKALVNNPDSSSSPATPRVLPVNTLHSPMVNQYTMINGSTRPQTSFAAALPSHGHPHVRFKESPFYTILEPLTPVIECKVRESTRDQVDCKINLRADIAERMQRESSTRAMIYCASDMAAAFSKVDVAFPHQVEIRVNLDEVKANLRGLKNKPGSTRPADITDMLRKRAGYDNPMTVTFESSFSLRFFLVVNLVKRHPVDELVAKLKSGKTISRDQVIREMNSKAQDTDIVATSSIMSLKCPLSTLRIDVACRSTICTHNQCFDASSFLQLQEQAPTWTCPVCNKVVTFELLEVDQYVNDILNSTPRSVEQVTIEPNGQWFQTSQADKSSRRNNDRSDCDEDEDLVEIKDIPRIAAVKAESASDLDSLAWTPPASSREQSTLSAAPRPASGKRPIGQIIDLTFSSDEDEPPRAPKRQIASNSSNGFPSFLGGLENARPKTNGTGFGVPKPSTMIAPPISDYLPRGYGNPP